MLAGPASAAQRVALVIGNASYAHAPALANPLNDAADIGAAFGRLGFAVTRIENAGSRSSSGAACSEVRNSPRRPPRSRWCSTPVTASRWTGATFSCRSTRALRATRTWSSRRCRWRLVSRAVERASGLRLVILDACRDNPFPGEDAARRRDALDRAGACAGGAFGRDAGGVRGEGGDGGLRRYRPRNSPYSEALLAHLEEPGLEVGLMFRKVRDAVVASTGGRQEPFVYGSLSSRGVYLAAESDHRGGSTHRLHRVVGQRDRSRSGWRRSVLRRRRLAAERELLFWESIKDSDEPADFLAYLGRYPDGEYEVLARNRLSRLEESAQARAEESDVAPAPEAERRQAAMPPVTAGASPETVESLLALDRSERRRIQRGLAALGFEPGPADGLFGNRTRLAVRSYQKEKGHAETGYLDVESAKFLLAAVPPDAAISTATDDSTPLRTSGGAAAKSEPSRVSDPTEIFLASGLSLSDWVLLAEDRLESGDYRSLLVEGAGHLRKFGTIDTVASVVERAIGGLIEDIRVLDRASAQSALESVRRIKDVVGERVALHRIEAEAHSRLGQFEYAAAAYRSWLRTAPPDHPERKKIATALQMVLRGEQPLEASDPFRDCAECPQMIVLPPGKFRMGSTSNEAERYFDEGPVRDVTIPRPIAVGMHEITFSEWDACRRAGGCVHNPSDNGWGRESRPVVNVSWTDAQEYVRWLSKRTGKRYRLPSESEWEYAARGGTATRYHWGDDPGPNRANCKRCGDPLDASRTLPVGSFPPNPFGLFDMHGNVWEWVEDCWNWNYRNAPSDGSAWVVQLSCNHRMLRGGSWSVGPRNVRSAVRSRFSTGLRSDSIGFRVARTY